MGSLFTSQGVQNGTKRYDEDKIWIIILMGLFEDGRCGAGLYTAQI